MKFIHYVLFSLLITAIPGFTQSAIPGQGTGSEGTVQSASDGAPSAAQNQPAQGPSSTGADQPQAAPPAKSIKDADSGPSDKKSGTTAATSNDRLFFALPNFLTVDANGKIIPLTARQKFKVVARGAFDPVQIPWYGILSGISQAENSEPGYGQGWEGYGKRFGAYAADGTIENFFVGAILPSVFRQDPRFFPSGQGSFVHRASYAVSRIVVTRSDSGKREFNISEVLGAAMSASISTYSYHPRDDRTIGNTASVWVSQMGYDAITIVLKEFWPDIRRKIKKQPKN